MKPIWTLVALISVGTLHAQPNLAFELTPQLDAVDNMYSLFNAGSSSYPEDGVDQVWDLSTMTLQLIASQALTQAGTTPYAADFPGANKALTRTYPQSAPTVSPSLRWRGRR